MKYLLLDYFILVLVLLQTWKLGKKESSAWLYGAAGSFCAIIVGILMSSIPFTLLNVVLLGLCVRNYLLWEFYNDE